RCSCFALDASAVGQTTDRLDPAVARRRPRVPRACSGLLRGSTVSERKAERTGARFGTGRRTFATGSKLEQPGLASRRRVRPARGSGGPGAPGGVGLEVPGKTARAPTAGRPGSRPEVLRWSIGRCFRSRTGSSGLLATIECEMLSCVSVEADRLG